MLIYRIKVFFSAIIFQFLLFFRTGTRIHTHTYRNTSSFYFPFHSLFDSRISLFMICRHFCISFRRNHFDIIMCSPFIRIFYHHHCCSHSLFNNNKYFLCVSLPLWIHNWHLLTFLLMQRRPILVLLLKQEANKCSINWHSIQKYCDTLIDDSWIVRTTLLA